MKKRITILLGMIFFYTLNYSQALKNENKIDPIFRAMIIDNQKNILPSADKKTPASKARGTELPAIRKQPIIEKYECIVYTKDAKVLKDKGIIVNSALPTFATVVVTLKQIEQMAAMAEVTYIEAPKTDYPTQPKPRKDASKSQGIE